MQGVTTASREAATRALDDYNSLDDTDGSDPGLDFVALRWTSEFVDKTMLINCILKDQKRRILLTAPPLFGKSINVDICLKYKLFKDLKIYMCNQQCTDNHACETKRLFRKHCGQHLVISLDFGELSGTSTSEFMASCRRMLTKQFEKHSYVINEVGEQYTWSGNNMGTLEIGRFLQYMKPAEDDNDWLTADNCSRKCYILVGFDYLIRVVSAHFQTKRVGKKIIVLVDEFNAPFIDMIFSEMLEYDVTCGFMRGLLSLFCKNRMSKQHIERVVIFSVTTLGVMHIMSSNNVELRTVFNDFYGYHKYFGFTSEEVEALVKRNVAKDQQQKAQNEIALWYKDYQVDCVHRGVYNPVSITRYLQNLTLKSYWVDSVGTKRIGRLLKFEKIHKKLSGAIRNNDVFHITPSRYINGYAIKTLSEAFLQFVDEKHVDCVIEFLAEYGYFNFVRKQFSMWTLQIPNGELRKAFSDELSHAMIDKSNNLSQ